MNTVEADILRRRVGQAGLIIAIAGAAWLGGWLGVFDQPGQTPSTAQNAHITSSASPALPKPDSEGNILSAATKPSDSGAAYVAPASSVAPPPEVAPSSSMPTQTPLPTLAPPEPTKLPVPTTKPIPPHCGTCGPWPRSPSLQLACPMYCLNDAGV